MRQSSLEFELRLQQYIELKRNGQTREARHHLQKYVLPQLDAQAIDTHRAAGILAYSSNTRMEPYKVGVIHLSTHMICY